MFLFNYLYFDISKWHPLGRYPIPVIQKNIPSAGYPYSIIWQNPYSHDSYNKFTSWQILYNRHK